MKMAALCRINQNAIYNLSAVSNVVELPKGHVIVQEGEPIDRVFFLKEGEIART